MNSIVIKNKTVKDAINLGLDLLQVSESEVDIEVVQPESNQFFGVHRKKAVVKLTKISKEAIKKSSVDDLMKDLLKSRPIQEVNKAKEQEPIIKEEEIAEAWVKNGQLYCKSTLAKFPTIKKGPGISVYCNNHLIKSDIIIGLPEDTYEIKVAQEQHETKWHIEVSENQLEAILHVTPGYQTENVLADKKPASMIELSVIERKVTKNSLTYGQVIAELTRLQIRTGINYHEISAAVATNVAGQFVIAKGTPPIEGKNGWIEIKVNIHPVKQLKEDNGKINHRESQFVPSVEAGSIIAVVHSPIPGLSGLSVRNTPIQPKPKYPIILKEGKGISLFGDNVVAIKSGRPYIEKRGQLVYVDMLPKMTHSGNVNLESGNLHFKGDIEVLGEVAENMTVEAAGDVLLRGITTQATVTSGGAIIANSSVIGCTLSAGQGNLVIAELGPIVKKLDEDLASILLLVYQLIESPAFKTSDLVKKGLQPLLSLLTESRFQYFKKLAKQYIEKLQEGEGYIQCEEWKEVGSYLKRIILTLTPQPVYLDHLLNLSHLLKECIELSKKTVEPNANIHLRNVLSSKVYCNGNVLVSNGGCTNTFIHAGGYVKVNGSLRGGEVYGNQGVYVKESGGESSVKTTIAVAANEEIKIGLAKPGTVLKFGHVTYRLYEEKRNLVAKLDEHNMVVFE